MNTVGRVSIVRGEICIVRGLEGIGLGNVVIFSTGAKGIVLGFRSQSAEVIMLGAINSIRKGDLVRVFSQSMTIGVDDALLGRVISPLGEPLDGKGAIEMPPNTQYPIEVPARPIHQREIIERPLKTGYLSIDSQIPLGLGQRELLLGEQNAGQSETAIDIMCNQKNLATGVLSIYVAIDAEAAAVKRRILRLEESGALQNSIIVVGRASDSASIHYIAPMAATTIAEYFAAKGRDVLIVYDNLTNHAKAYRHISLLLDRPVSREAYPGDIFYLHSRLLERSGAFNITVGGGTITALPIVETQNEDSTDFIPTNLMSITDGHVLFRRSLANKGEQPPIDSGFSVSRIGSRVQYPLMRTLSDKVRDTLIKYEEVARFMSFGADIGSESLEAYDLGKIAHIVLQQDHTTYYSPIEECILMYMVVSGSIRQWPESQVKTVTTELLHFIRSEPYSNILNTSMLVATYEDSLSVLRECIADFLKHPDTTKPLAKETRLVAEIETVSELLRKDNEDIE